MKKIGLDAWVRYLEGYTIHSIPQRTEAAHAAYSQFPGSPTGVSLRLYRAELSDFSRPDERLVLILPASLYHRTYSGQRFDPRRPPQLLSPLLQRRGLGSRLVVADLGQDPHPHVRRRWRDRNRRRRYPVPQAWLDHLRHGHASRSATIQSRLEGLQLGARLGRLVLGGALPVGTDQGLVSAAVVPAVSQPAGTGQGTQGQKAARRCQPSHSPRVVPRDAGLAGIVVSPAAVCGQRRQRLWWPERAAASARQRGSHQPCASQGRLVRAADARGGTPRSTPQERRASAYHGRLGGRCHQAVARTGLRSVWLACHPLGQNATGLVLQGRQGPPPNHRPGARHPGQASRPDVLRHASGLGCPPHPLDLCGALGDRSHLRELQTIARLGRPSQSQTQSHRAHGPDGFGVVQLRGHLVRARRPSVCAFSRSSLVHQEVGTLLCRYAEYAKAAQLGRENKATPPQKWSAHQYGGAVDQLCQPCGLKRSPRRPCPSFQAQKHHLAVLKNMGWALPERIELLRNLN